MAYSFKTKISATGVGAGRVWTLTIDEFEAAASSQWSVGGLPTWGTITLTQVRLLSGAAGAIKPRLGKQTNWLDNTLNEINHRNAAATYINDPTAVEYDTRDQDYPGIIWGNALVNAGTNNRIRWILTIKPGHLA